MGWPGQFAGKTVLVTGAARNIGLATVRAFAGEGASVMMVDLRGDDLDVAWRDVAKDFPGTGRCACDVADESSVESAIKAAIDAFGRLDVIVNNAGICTLNLAVDLTVNEWDRVLAVNLRGPWLMTKHGAPLMAPGGAIVNIASQAAQRAQKFTAHYSASKMGVIGLTRALALELAPAIRVNAVSPGTVETVMIEDEVRWRIARGENDSWDDVVKFWLDRVPMGRFQQPEHIANAILFLASDAASEITGETLNVSGGAVMV